MPSAIAGGVLEVVCVARVLRLIKVCVCARAIGRRAGHVSFAPRAQNMENVRILFLTIGRSLGPLGNVAALLGLLLFIYRCARVRTRARRSSCSRARLRAASLACRCLDA